MRKQLKWSSSLAVVLLLMLSCDDPARLNAPETPEIVGPSFDQSNGPDLDTRFWKGQIASVEYYMGDPYRTDGTVYEYCRVEVRPSLVVQGGREGTRLEYHCRKGTWGGQTQWKENGDCIIPDQHVKGSVTGRFTLNTNTSAEAIPAPDCTYYDGNGGPINLTWRRTDKEMESWTGASVVTTTRDEGPSCVRSYVSAGPNAIYSAFVQGSAFELDNIEVSTGRISQLSTFLWGYNSLDKVQVFGSDDPACRRIGI